MKTSLTIIGLACLLGITAGCVRREVVYRERPAPAPVATPPPPAAPQAEVAEEPSENVVVNEAPPPPQREVVIASPGPAYVWVPGFWTWRNRWVWVGGRWMIGPHPHAIWVNGRWANRRGHYIWVRGYWR